MIVDTNALSAMADAQPGVAEKLTEARLISIPAVVLGEFLFGISQSRRRIEYERWIKIARARCRILEVGSDTATKYAEVRLELKRSGTPIPSNDTWIAALCLQYALPLLSRDRHFDRVGGIRRIEW